MDTPRRASVFVYDRGASPPVRLEIPGDGHHCYIAEATFTFPPRYDFNEGAFRLIGRRLRRRTLRKLARHLGRPVGDTMTDDLLCLTFDSRLTWDADGYPVTLAIRARADLA